ncbi:EAL domain-containing protein [Zavarzinia sp. CC-PAN008]|uniref:EAL domain-containing protein n=1 Tax=Zavarzinia sp. CC-PAN008 TaxID=3243332 RepID=UPI003F748E5C
MTRWGRSGTGRTAQALEAGGSRALRADPGDGDAEALLAALGHEIAYAFQPVVLTHTGGTYGFEALLRGHDRLGMASIQELFDTLHQHGVLAEGDAILRRIALRAFAGFGPAMGAKLFYNMDNRLIGQALPELAGGTLPASSVCFEISERHSLEQGAATERTLAGWRAQGHLLALDDFGAGHAGMQMLHAARPDLVKIDRFFIAGVDRDRAKKTLLGAMVAMAHGLGMNVVAEGVETEAELMTVRELGCEMVQGYFVQRPSLEAGLMLPRYEVVAAASRRERRGDGPVAASQGDSTLIRNELAWVEPLCLSDPMTRAFEFFRRDAARTFQVVVDADGAPRGIIREQDLKEYIYSPFGRDVLANKNSSKKLWSFVRPCPQCDINGKAERILEAYAQADDPQALLVVEDGRYAGLLSSASVVRLINAKHLALARDQNPLTRLPGNTQIMDFVSRQFEDDTGAVSLCYFDIDNFKPFNDAMGFRQGDRAIRLFADQMRAHFPGLGTFLGHIGGDDFFAAIPAASPQAVRAQVGQLLAGFADDARAFYDEATRRRGSIEGRDREGRPRSFGLLSASAAVLHLPDGPRRVTLDRVLGALADMKRSAKLSPGGICEIAACALEGQGIQLPDRPSWPAPATVQGACATQPAAFHAPPAAASPTISPAA